MGVGVGVGVGVSGYVIGGGYYLYLFEGGVVTTSEFAFFLDFFDLGLFFDDLRVFLECDL